MRFTFLLRRKLGRADQGTRAAVEFPANTSNLAAWYALMVDNALRWGQEGWGGHITVRTVLKWGRQRLFSIFLHIGWQLDLR